jgi:hypothetical protein
VNDILFLTSFPDSSVLMYRKATGFCMLVCYPAILLEVFLNSKILLVEFYVICLLIYYSNEY